MSSFNFNLRSSKQSKRLIYLIIRYNGNTLIYPTKLNTEYKHWNLSTQRVKDTYDNSINDVLDEILHVAKGVFRQTLLKNSLKPPSTKDLRINLNNRFNNTNDESSKTTFKGFINTFCNSASKRVYNGKRISKDTVLGYIRTKDNLEKYSKYIRRSIEFEDIDLVFYNNYNDWLTDTCKFSINTVGKYIKNIKTIMRSAFDQRLTDNRFFDSGSFSVLKEKSEHIYLNYKELQSVYDLELSESYLDNARDLFLIGAFTGLRYSDIVSLSEDMVIDDFAEVKAKKTGKSTLIPFNHWIVKSIRSKYGGFPRKISNQKLNRYIKIVCSRIDSLNVMTSKTSTIGGELTTIRLPKYKRVQSHTGRRSFISNLILDGIPIHSIMSISGHSSEQLLLGYVKVKPRESIKAVSDLYQGKKRII